MMSNGSGSETFYDDRYRTDGFVFLNSRVGFRDVIDGTSNTVAMSGRFVVMAKMLLCRRE